MISLPVDSIAKIASFLPLCEQVKAFPEFNNCLKKLEDKKKIIRRVVYNWLLDYSNYGHFHCSKESLKRFTSLATRKKLLKHIRGNSDHMFYEIATKFATFSEIVDQLVGIQPVWMLNEIIKIRRA